VDNAIAEAMLDALLVTDASRARDIETIVTELYSKNVHSADAFPLVSRPKY